MSDAECGDLPRHPGRSPLWSFHGVTVRMAAANYPGFNPVEEYLTCECVSRLAGQWTGELVRYAGSGLYARLDPHHHRGRHGISAPVLRAPRARAAPGAAAFLP